MWSPVEEIIIMIGRGEKKGRGERTKEPEKGRKPEKGDQVQVRFEEETADEVRRVCFYR